MTLLSWQTEWFANHLKSGFNKCAVGKKSAQHFAFELVNLADSERPASICLGSDDAGTTRQSEYGATEVPTQ